MRGWKPFYLQLLTLVFSLVLVCQGGCASVEEKDDLPPKPLIKKIEFVGVTIADKDELIQYLYMDETSWLEAIGLADPHYYISNFTIEDKQRLERYYESFGYYHAKVTDIEALPLNKDGSKVKVRIAVEEGQPALVRDVAFHWSSSIEEKAAVESRSKLIRGKAFSMAALTESAAELQLALNERGYALASVKEHAKVNRDDNWADIDFAITPGPKCHIGQIRFIGLATIPQKLVEVEIHFAYDQAYSPTLIAQIEKSVYAMDVFNTVDVQPAKALNEQGLLDITIQVVEGQHQRLKVGGGIGIEPNRWDGHLKLQYTHYNLGRQLIRFDLSALAGYAVLPYPWDVKEHGPIFKVQPWFKKKGWLESQLVWSLQPSFELGVEEGYQFHATKLRVGLSRFLFKFTLAEISYNAHFFDFFDKSPAFDSNKTLLGRDFMDPFFVDYFEVGYTLFFTDDFLEPKNGVTLGARFTIAGSWMGSDYDFMTVTPEVKGYWQVFSHLQIAARARTGLLFPYGSKPGAPISMKLYLGGSDTVRGWGLKRLSPRIQDCSDGSCRSIPIGGHTSILGNFELRFMTIKQLFIVPFFDFGDVQEGEADYKPSKWNYSTGGGLRYASPIGKFRLDFGWRLNNDAVRFPDDKRWAIHLSFGETF